MEKEKKRSFIIVHSLVMFHSALGIFLCGVGIFEEHPLALKGLFILGLVVFTVLFQRSFNELCNITNNNDKFI